MNVDLSAPSTAARFELHVEDVTNYELGYESSFDVSVTDESGNVVGRLGITTREHVVPLAERFLSVIDPGATLEIPSEWRHG